ncbi:MAG: hypothetical protein IAF08_16290 [Rhizobacter sp.]|nr:hypothetical protein [Chlorobiales bacterium]
MKTERPPLQAGRAESSEFSNKPTVAPLLRLARKFLTVSFDDQVQEVLAWLTALFDARHLTTVLKSYRAKAGRKEDPAMFIRLLCEVNWRSVKRRHERWHERWLGQSAMRRAPASNGGARPAKPKPKRAMPDRTNPMMRQARLDFLDAFTDDRGKQRRVRYGEKAAFIRHLRRTYFPGETDGQQFEDRFYVSLRRNRTTDKKRLREFRHPRP